MVQLSNGTTSMGTQTLLEIKHLSVDYLAASGAVHLLSRRELADWFRPSTTTWPLAR